MRRIFTPVVLVAVAVATLWSGSNALAGPPEVASAIEGRAVGTDQVVLVLFGKKVSKFKTFALADEDSNALGTPELSFASMPF